MITNKPIWIIALIVNVFTWAVAAPNAVTAFLGSLLSGLVLTGIFLR